MPDVKETTDEMDSRYEELFKKIDRGLRLNYFLIFFITVLIFETLRSIGQD